MQYKARVLKMSRSAVMAIALLAALAFGGGAASNNIGLTECDAPGCAIATNSNDGVADFQITDVAPVNGWGAYVSAGPADVGFTR